MLEKGRKRMIYLYIALYPEAKPVIHRLKLKRQKSLAGFDIYENGELGVRLILTGPGSLAAAVAVGSSLAFYQAGEKDILVNWGSCAAEEDFGKVYRCHKLIDRISHYTFYPDMLIRSSLPEACIVTEPQAWEKPENGYNKKASQAILHDMEAAAVYYAGSHFFAPHQMYFFKVVSDHGTETFSKELFARVMEQSTEIFIEQLKILSSYQISILRQEEEPPGLPEESETIFDEFHCSQTMKAAFAQCIRYWILAGKDYQKELQIMRNLGGLPCKDKREGKKRFEQLKSKLL